MTTKNEAWDAVANVEGWMSRNQSDTLFDAALSCPPGGQIVEIGSFHGRSTIVLALVAPKDSSITAIDPHAGNDRGPQEIAGFAEAANTDYELFNANLSKAGVADRVTHLRMFSDVALSEVAGPVDVLYIDGAHRYSPARSDIRNWGALVSDGGVMLIHDSFSSIGVTLAIARELFWSSRFTYEKRAASMTVYRAVPCKSRGTNLCRQVLQLPWFVRNLGLKVLLILGLGKLCKRAGRQVPEWPY